MLIELGRDNFENEVLMSTEPILVDFWGPQCQPCLALMPTIEKFAADYAGKVKFTKVNAANNRMLCAKLKVMNLPTFILYKDGAEIIRLSGESANESRLLEAIQAVIA